MEQIIFGLTPRSRGPRPPSLVCSSCDATIAEDWTNPILAYAKKHGRYEGDTTGGTGLCDVCLEVVKNPEKPVERAVVIDCPEILRDATMATYALDGYNRSAVTAACQWMDGDGQEPPVKDLLLFGRTGTGKTRLAVSLARELGGTSRYVRVPALFRMIKDAFANDRPAPLNAYVQAPLLILDDLGAERPTSFTMSTLETLYTERLDAGRRTIFTSNLPISRTGAVGKYDRTLSEQLDDARFLSRLVGSSEWIELVGPDRRLS